MTSSLSFLLLVAPCAADIILSRTFDKVPGNGTIVVEGSACTSTDAYGSNDCDVNWGQTYSIDLDLHLTQNIVAGSTITVDAKLDNFIPLKLSCPACGANCTVTIPIVKKTFTFELPACPIVATGLTQKITYTLPATSPVPLKIGLKGTVKVNNPSGGVIAQVDITGSVSPKDRAAASVRAAELRKQAKEVLGLDLGTPCSGSQCSGIDCSIAIASCAVACATAFPAGCVSCIGAYPSCCRCASEHFGFDCSDC